MKKKIFYWSPCLDRVGTVISTINSAISLSRYDKYNDVRIINVCGEWDQYRKMLKDNSVNLIDFKFKYFKILPKKGFIRSRFSYIIIYLLSFFPLFFLLKKEKPDKNGVVYVGQKGIILANGYGIMKFEDGRMFFGYFKKGNLRD